MKTDKKLTTRPEPMPRKRGGGHDHPSGKAVGGMRNVMNASSHTDKMKSC